MNKKVLVSLIAVLFICLAIPGEEALAQTQFKCVIEFDGGLAEDIDFVILTFYDEFFLPIGNPVEMVFIGNDAWDFWVDAIPPATVTWGMEVIVDAALMEFEEGTSQFGPVPDQYDKTFHQE